MYIYVYGYIYIYIYIHTYICPYVRISSRRQPSGSGGSWGLGAAISSISMYPYIECNTILRFPTDDYPPHKMTPQ